MRIPPMPQVCSGLLCTTLILISGCSNPSSQTLDSLTVTATPATVSVGGATTLKAVAHLSDGTTQDVTSGTQWTLSNPALATMSSAALTAKAPGTLTVQAAYVETTPAGTSPAAATTTPQNLSASTQVTITAATSNQHTSQYSDHYLEYSRSHCLWHRIEQYPAQRHGQCAGNLCVFTGGRDRT